MKFFALLALAVGALAQKNHAINFSALPASPPASKTNPTLIGAGQPVTPNPYQRLTFGSQYRVVTLNNSYTPLIKIPSASNVLVSANVTTGIFAGDLRKFDDDATITLKGFSFACVQENGTAIVPVACSVNIIGIKPSECGSSVRRSVLYGGGKKFQRAKILLNNLLRLTFTVQQVATQNTGPVSLLMDDLNYATLPKKSSSAAALERRCG